MAEDSAFLEELRFETVQQGAEAGGEAGDMEGFAGEDVSFAQELEACWSAGPLRVCASIVGGNQIRVTASLAGVTILSGTLNPSRPRLCVNVRVGIAKAEFCVILDIANRQVRLQGRFCVWVPILGWRCTSFNVRLLSW